MVACFGVSPEYQLCTLKQVNISSALARVACALLRHFGDTVTPWNFQSYWSPMLPNGGLVA